MSKLAVPGVSANVDYKLVLAGGLVVLVIYYVITRDAKNAIKGVGDAIGETLAPIGRTAEAVADSINPLNNENIFYSGVNAIGRVASGDVSWSLGSWLYDRFNPPYDPNTPPFVPRQGSVRPNVDPNLTR
jgi:hypothetical protein